MAATTVKLGHGTLFKRGDGAGSESFVTVTEMVEVGLPRMTRPAIDATHQESPNGAREYIAGLLNGGEIEVGGHYLPTDSTQNFGASGLGTDFFNGTRRNFQIVLPSGLGTFSFSGIITAWNPQAPIDGKLGLRLTIQICGRPSFA